jgi:DNA polymerase III delta prime subunit
MDRAAPKASAGLILFSEKWTEWKKLHQLEKETGLKFPRGKFTLAEVQTLDDSLKKWLKGHNIPFEVFQASLQCRGQKILEGDMSRQLYIQLAMSLGTGRPVKTVYTYVRRRYHPEAHSVLEKKEQKEKNNLPINETVPESTKRIRRMNWTAYEDAMLREAVQQHGRAWEKIGQDLKISPMACLQRWRFLELPPFEWTPERDSRLMSLVVSLRQKQLEKHHEAVNETMKIDDIMAIEEDAVQKIFWTQVATGVGDGVYALQCAHRYYTFSGGAHVCVESIDDSNTGKVKSKMRPGKKRSALAPVQVLLWTHDKDLALLRQIQRMNYMHEEDIHWRAIGYYTLYPSFDRLPEASKVQTDDAEALSRFRWDVLRSRFLALKKKAPKHCTNSLDSLLAYYLDDHGNKL